MTKAHFGRGGMRGTRRSCLRGLAAGSIAALARPFAPDARGQVQVPKRLVILYMPNCAVRARWRPTGGRDPIAGQGDARQFDLNYSNASFERVRNQMTIIDGFDQIEEGQDAHLNPQRVMMTGQAMSGLTSGAYGPSIDQVLLQRSALLKGTATPSLQVAADSRVVATNNRHFEWLNFSATQTVATPYGTEAAAMPAEDDPYRTFSRLFGSAVPPAGGNLDALRAREKSILDFVVADLQRLNARLPAAQRAKLDQHLTGIRDVERSFEAALGNQTMTTPAGIELVQPNVSANHAKLLEQYLGVVTAAIQNDVTRVATMMFGSGNSGVVFGDVLPNFGSRNGLHGLAHDWHDKPDAPLLGEVTRFYCEAVTRFVERLGQTVENDGSTLLDNTLIVLWSEVSQYHTINNMPVVLFGGRRLGHTGGRALRYPGRSANQIWVPIAQAFGVPLTTFGSPAYNKGTLPELLA